MESVCTIKKGYQYKYLKQNAMRELRTLIHVHARKHASESFRVYNLYIRVKGYDNSS